MNNISRSPGESTYTYEGEDEIHYVHSDSHISDDDLLALALEDAIREAGHGSGDIHHRRNRRTHGDAFGTHAEAVYTEPSAADVDSILNTTDEDDLLTLPRHVRRAARRRRVIPESTGRGTSPEDDLISTRRRDSEEFSVSTTSSDTPVAPNVRRRRHFVEMNPIIMSDDDETEKSSAEPIDITELNSPRAQFYEELDDDELAVKETLENPPDVKDQKGIRHYECPICFDNPETLAVIPCGKCKKPCFYFFFSTAFINMNSRLGHMYCSGCVFKAIEVKGNCSICRTPVKHTQVKFLEFKVKQ